MMPSIQASNPAGKQWSGPLFLGVELATDQIRASVVDENLELVHVEVVDFDSELSEYATQGGIFTTPGEAFTTPVEMWIKGLDLLLDKLFKIRIIPHIKCIGGAAQHSLVWWKSTTIPHLSSLDPSLPLHRHFPSSSFSLPNSPVVQDTSAHAHALAIEALLGGPDRMAERVGTSANPSLVAAQLLRVREGWRDDVWNRTGRVQLASAFICSLFVGKWVPMVESEAVMTGLWVHHPHGSSQATGRETPGGTGAGQGGHWDEGVLDIVGGSREEGRRVRGWLGDVDTSSGSRRAGHIGKYMVERYKFDPETLIMPFIPDFLATYLSICPAPTDAVISFGPIDQLLTPSPFYLPTRLYNTFPHPMQALLPPSQDLDGIIRDVKAKESRDKEYAHGQATRKVIQGAGGMPTPQLQKRYILLLPSRNADVPRALVRDMYTKSWSAFDRLSSIMPPGGSIGLDDKLFSFWHLQADTYPLSHVKGIYRFEGGVKVSEFRDLRANPRVLIEGQVMGFRGRWGVLSGLGVVSGASRALTTAAYSGDSRPGSGASTPNRQVAFGNGIVPILQPRKPPAYQASLGLPYDPYDTAALPRRIFGVGGAVNFPSVAGLVSDVFNTPLYVPLTQIHSAAHGNSPHRNTPATGFPSRGSLGAAWVGRWGWGLLTVSGASASLVAATSSGDPPNALSLTFEDEIKRIMTRRWNASGAQWGKTNVNPDAASGSTGGVGNGSSSNSAPGAPPGLPAPGSTPGSGTSTPYGTVGRSGLGNTVFVEEDEEDVVVNLSSYDDFAAATNVSTPPSTRLRASTTGSMSTLGSVGSLSTLGSLSSLSGMSSIGSITSADSGEDHLSLHVPGLAGLNGTSHSHLSSLKMPPADPSSRSNGSATNSQLGAGQNSGNGTGNSNSPKSALIPATPTPLTPIQPIPLGSGALTGTSSTPPPVANVPGAPPVNLPTYEDDVEMAKMGLAKVVEPDYDAFLGYASVLPEWERLGGLVVRGVV